MYTWAHLITGSGAEDDCLMAGYLYFHCSGVPCKGSISKTVRVCLLLACDQQVCMTVIEADTGASLVGLCCRAGRRVGGFVTVRSWLNWQIQVFVPIVFFFVRLRDTSCTVHVFAATVESASAKLSTTLWHQTQIQS